MLTVTPAASEHLANLIDESKGPEGLAVRLVVQEQGLALTPSEPKPDDTTFEHDGRTVLVVDPRAAEMLSERTIDIQQTEQGTGLAVS